MPIYAVQYAYTDDSAQRDAHRPAHQEFLQSLQDGGTVLVRGPFTDVGGGPGALIIVRAESAQQAGHLMDNDPFTQEGLVAQRTIREWGVLPGGPFG